MTTVGQALVAGLSARGVQVVFGIPGVHTVELYRGLAGSGIRHVTARHEQGAVFMADGFARVSGQPGVAFVISGPGLTNALTAMAQARADSVPVLVISGVPRRDTLGRGMGYLHELPDQAAMVRALCPTFQVTTPGDLGPVLDAAFAALTAGRPGPVHIEVPTDVMPLLPSAVPAPVHSIRAPAPDAGLLAQARDLLARSLRPVILAGGGARRQDERLTALATALDAPVVLTVNARGLMHGHPLVVPASASLRAVRDLIADADQILALGTELGQTDYDMNLMPGLPDMAGIIRVDICRQQLGRHAAAVPICADLATALPALMPARPRPPSGGAERAAHARKAARAELDPASLQRLSMVQAICRAQPGAIIVGDSTQPVYAANLYHDHPRPGGWFNAATGFGALGFAPGAAVGAAIAAPGVPVICLIGDGGLQFSSGELRTAVDESLPVTFVVWNNHSFREIAEAMQAVGSPVIGCHPSALQMGPFAAACDLPFQSVPNTPDALYAALLSATSGPRLIEVRAD